MFEQPADFGAECDALYDIVAPLDEAEFSRPGQFKGWTINDVLGHLHTWNWAANAGLNDPGAFDEMSKQLTALMAQGQPMRAYERKWLAGLAGHELLNTWREFYQTMIPGFTNADPKRRVKWMGPDMSVRSSITARQMETWAHSQAVFDMLGIHRRDGDRIKNIAVLCANTFGWCYTVRGLPVPATPPHLRLTLPSGALWTWFEPSEDNLIEGSATEFCQVSAQVRNIADTKLKFAGATARQWMSIAQCFAGPPEQPPAPGSRFVKSG